MKIYLIKTQLTVYTLYVTLLNQQRLNNLFITSKWPLLNSRLVNVFSKEEVKAYSHSIIVFLLKDDS